MCSSAPFIFTDWELKRELIRTVMKLIFAVCVYKYICWVFLNFFLTKVLSSVFRGHFCFSQIFFLMFFLFHVVLHFLGSKLTLKKKVVAKDAKMGKFHHTEAKR